MIAPPLAVPSALLLENVQLLMLPEPRPGTVPVFTVVRSNPPPPVKVRRIVRYRAPGYCQRTK
jgi:hypothetical protein